MADQDDNNQDLDYIYESGELPFSEEEQTKRNIELSNETEYGVTQHKYQQDQTYKERSRAQRAESYIDAQFIINLMLSLKKNINNKNYINSLSQKEKNIENFLMRMYNKFENIINRTIKNKKYNEYMKISTISNRMYRDINNGTDIDKKKIEYYIPLIAKLEQIDKGFIWGGNRKSKTIKQNKKSKTMKQNKKSKTMKIYR